MANSSCPIAGVAAKEVVVSSMGILYGISNVSSKIGTETMAGLLGATGFTALNAYSLMVFLFIICTLAKNNCYNKKGN